MPLSETDSKSVIPDIAASSVRRTAAVIKFRKPGTERAGILLDEMLGVGCLSVGNILEFGEAFLLSLVRLPRVGAEPFHNYILEVEERQFGDRKFERLTEYGQIILKFAITLGKLRTTWN